MKRLVCRLFGHRWGEYFQVGRNASGVYLGMDCVIRSHSCSRCGYWETGRSYVPRATA